MVPNFSLFVNALSNKVYISIVKMRLVRKAILHIQYMTIYCAYSACLSRSYCVDSASMGWTQIHCEIIFERRIPQEIVFKKWQNITARSSPKQFALILLNLSDIKLKCCYDLVTITLLELTGIIYFIDTL